MKKMIIIVLMLFFFIPIVYANDLFISSKAIDNNYDMVLDVIGVEEGYYLVNNTNSKTNIVKYANNDNIYASKQLNKLNKASLFNYDGNIYVVGFNKLKKIDIYVLDNNLRIVNQVNTDIYYNYKDNTNIKLYSYENNLYMLLMNDGYLGDTNIYKISTDLNIDINSYVSYESSILSNILGSDYYLLLNSLENENIKYYDSKYFNGKYVLVGKSDNAYIRVIDDNSNIIKEINNNDYKYYKNVFIINNYMIVSALDNDNNWYLLKYDSDYNYLDRIDIDSSYLRIVNNNLLNVGNHLFFYKFNNEIMVIESDFGTINVVEYSDAYREVSLLVNANSGYKVDDLIVLDNNGNNVEVNNGNFIMPVGGVTVSASYTATVINPDTVDMIFVVLGSLVLLVILYHVLYKKFKWLQ